MTDNLEAGPMDFACESDQSEPMRRLFEPPAASVHASRASWPLSARRRRAAPVRLHDVLVTLQAADGSWDLTPEFARAIGVEFDQLLAALAGAAGNPKLAARALATALAVAWLEANASGARTEWDMLAAKASRWLTACSATPASGEAWADLAVRIVKG
jgi:hypothetical protein